MPTTTFSPERPAPHIDPLYEAAARQRLTALTTTVGGLAHNVRSPLTAIMGRAELIGIRQPEMAGKMNDIVDQCDRINAMLKEVAAALAFEAEQAPRPVSLNTLIERECGFLSLDRHFKHDVRKEFALAEALPGVTAWYGKLARAFAALVDNAVTAMHGAFEHHLTIATETAQDAVRLSVRDSGCGIAPEHLPHVFDPGFSTRTGDRFGAERVEGTGLGYGLAYVAVVVHELGGTTEVSSEPGAGTTVTITLPIN